MENTNNVLNDIKRSFFVAPTEEEKREQKIFLICSKVMFGLAIAITLLAMACAGVGVGIIDKDAKQGIVALRQAVLIIGTIVYICTLGFGIYYTILLSKRRSVYNPMSKLAFNLMIVVLVFLLGAIICQILGLSFGHIKTKSSYLMIPLALFNGLLFLTGGPLIGMTRSFTLQNRVFKMATTH